MSLKQRKVFASERKIFDVIRGIYVTRQEIYLDDVREVFLKPIRIDPKKHFNVVESKKPNN